MTPSPELRVILTDDFHEGREKSPFQGMSPASLASCTACVRRLALSLSRTRPAWVFTVFSLT